jgi:hypothetical protein
VEVCRAGAATHGASLTDALGGALAESRPMTADALAAWKAFNADFEELLWATEWLHMSLAAKPGG